MTKHKIWSVFFVLLFLMSCENASQKVEMKNLKGTWNKKAEQKFDFKINDAQNSKNIIFVVRNNNDYPYSNIRFIVNFTEGETKNNMVDSLDYVLAQPTGELTGK